MTDAGEKERLRQRMHGVVAAKLRALAAEVDVMRAQILVVVDQGEVLGYLEKLGASLRVRADLIDREEKGTA